jgi:hypothetical protein
MRLRFLCLDLRGVGAGLLRRLVDLVSGRWPPLAWSIESNAFIVGYLLT